MNDGIGLPLILDDIRVITKTGDVLQIPGILNFTFQRSKKKLNATLNDCSNI